MNVRSTIAAVAALVALFAPGTAQATVPGANGRIAFAAAGDIYTINPDGTGVVNLTNGTVPGARMPSWSPDATQIVFSATATTPSYSDIFVIEAAGGAATNITNTPSIYEYEAAWSPDGAELAFVSDETGAGNDIFAMNPDGTGRTNLSNDNYFWTNFPAWSPDGTRIAFETQRADDNFNNAIWVMNADGGAQTDVSQNFAYNGYVEPNWSPDGSKIVFAASGTPMPLQTINPDGTGQASMPGSAPSERDPVWSPDGQQVAFQSSFNGDIYTRNVDGSGTSHLAAGANPDWARMPADAPPDCAAVAADRASLWPPNQRFRHVALRGASDPDGDPVTLDITGVTQDEPVRGAHDKKAPDARVTSRPDQVRLRAERDPGGDGRVYVIAFTASDGQGGECEGTAQVEVRRLPRRQAVDSAPPSYDSFGN